MVAVAVGVGVVVVVAVVVAVGVGVGVGVGVVVAVVVAVGVGVGVGVVVAVVVAVAVGVGVSQMSDLHAEALARIAERRGLIAALMGAGEWKVTTATFDDYQFGICRDHRIGPLGLNCRSSETHATGVCAAVNSFGPLLDLAEATLLRHVPHGHVPICAGPCIAKWPCPDATAALRSLGLVTT